MTTLIGEKLRDFPEGRVLVTALCCLVLIIEFSGVLEERANAALVEQFEANVTVAETRYADITDLNRAGAWARYEEFAIAYDHYAKAYNQWTQSRWERRLCHFSLAGLVLILLPVFVNGDRASIGMTTQGHEEWRSWGRALPALTVVTGVLAIPGLVAWWSIDGEVAKMLADPWHDPLAGFVLYPISEEIIYRMAICSAAAGWFGARPAIAVSGIVFGLMHVAYGVANPVNLVSGFVLAWSFLKSNTILVPITLHSFGNILGAVIIDCLGACFRHA